eukprot:COSAG02_NODE_52_length_44175_cov_97.989654_18_plen_608_part_00
MRRRCAIRDALTLFARSFPVRRHEFVMALMLLPPLPPLLVRLLLLLLAAVVQTLAGTEPSSVGKRAIFWEGKQVAFNATATDAVIRRGFTHAVVESLNHSRWFCDYRRGALRPILDISLHSKLNATPLRKFSPFSQADALQAANSTLMRLLLSTPACTAGVMDDIESLPFPLKSYDATGGVDSYHSTLYPDLPEMIGTSRSAASQLSHWPPFVDWPKRGAHQVPNLTIENIEYNFPKQVLQVGAGGGLEKQKQLRLGVGADAVLVAQVFSLSAETALSRADLVLQRPASKQALLVDGNNDRNGGAPLWEKAWGSLTYFIAECTKEGVPILNRKKLCVAGCGLSAREVATRASRKSLYLNPTESKLLPARQYAFVVQYNPPKRGLNPSNISGSFEIGCTGSNRSHSAKLQQPMLLADSGSHIVWRRALPGVKLELRLFAAQPPHPFTVDQFHTDWVSFRVSVMAGFVQTYKALALAVLRRRSTFVEVGQNNDTVPLEVFIYSGYADNPVGYPRSSHNYIGKLPDSYSVDWSTFADSGLDVALVGYGTQDPAPTRSALQRGSEHNRGAPPQLVCGARSDESEFVNRYKLCDGAFEIYSHESDPGFFVPA